MTYYRFQPLQPQSIRLIRIHPKLRPDGIGGQVEVDVEEHEFGTVKYDALSYTWGPPTLEEKDAAALQIFTTVQRVYPITCKGKLILLTKSLRDALYRLRSPAVPQPAKHAHHVVSGLERKTEYIWADGICINQDDLQERAEQVARMAQLYSKASSTLIYLGETGKHKDRVCAGLSLASTLSDLLDRKADLHLHRFGIFDASLFASVGARCPDEDDWREWAILMSREWFQRTWVVQEAILSGDVTTFVLCGEIAIPARHLASSLMLVHEYNWGRPLQTYLTRDEHPNPRYERYKVSINQWLLHGHPYFAVAVSWETKRKPSFLEVSRRLLPYTSCSDPRDKIYSTLGIATEWENHDRSILPINYTLSIEEIFSRATIAHITSSKTLDTFSLVSLRNITGQRHKLPSWCPDYAQKASALEPVSILQMSSNSPERWCAAGSSVCTLSSHVSNSRIVLNLRGKEVGVVQAHCRFEEPYPISLPVLDFLRSMLSENRTQPK